MQKRGVLLLSHCGYSFMEQICQNVAELGIECYILSSKPVENNNKRLNELKAIATCLSVSDSHQLTLLDVLSGIKKLKIKGKQVLACLSVWEGYRQLMSHANLSLGVKDLTSDKIHLLLDKYKLRKKLYALKFSQVKAEILTKSLFCHYKHQRQLKFIKPRRGIASYGAFKLTEKANWHDIKDISVQIKKDIVYQSIFTSSMDFIVEDFIPGVEYCFEIVCHNGEVNIIAIHEKLALDFSHNTVLEPGCISPPISLNEGERKKSCEFISQVFQALQLNWGCFHVEAKYEQGQWEIIEINPRVGGALICKSVEVLTQGKNLIYLWLKSLLEQNQTSQKLLYDHSVHGQSKRDCSTLFRVFFAEPNRMIKKIQTNKQNLSAEHTDIFLKKGETTGSYNREIFLAQALWRIDSGNDVDWQQVIDNTAKAIEVTYE